MSDANPFRPENSPRSSCTGIRASRIRSARSNTNARAAAGSPHWTGICTDAGRVPNASTTSRRASSTNMRGSSHTTCCARHWGRSECWRPSDTNTHPVREDGEGNHARVYVIHRIGPPADGRRDRARRHPGRGAGGVPLRPAGLRRPVAPVRVARGLRDWRTGSRVLAGGDRHVYDNHVDQFLEQLGREPYPYPTIEIRKADSLFDYQYEDFKVVGYQHRPIIKTPVAV